jgi:hypothetical protein
LDAEKRLLISRFKPFQPFNRYRFVQADSSEVKDQTLWAIKFWSEAIAVGNLNFVEKVKSELGFKAAHPAALRPFNSSKVQKFKR